MTYYTLSSGEIVYYVPCVYGTPTADPEGDHGIHTVLVSSFVVRFPPSHAFPG